MNDPTHASVSTAIHKIPQGDYPDPWPTKGWTNEQWATWLVEACHQLEAGDRRPDAEKMMKRALDISAMYSIRPADRYLDSLASLLQEACVKLDNNVTESLFTNTCRGMINKVKKLR